jgi:hypothetical protein
MKCTIHTTEPSILIHATAPNILQDAGLGDLFVVRAAASTSACSRCSIRTAHRRTFVLGQSNPDVVAIACRVDEGEPGYHAAGESMRFKASTPIQFVEQVEVASFRERGARGEPLSSQADD